MVVTECDRWIGEQAFHQLEVQQQQRLQKMKQQAAKVKAKTQYYSYLIHHPRRHHRPGSRAWIRSARAHAPRGQGRYQQGRTKRGAAARRRCAY